MTAANVLHVIPAVAPRYGGPSAAVLGMCQALRQIGVSTLVADHRRRRPRPPRRGRRRNRRLPGRADDLLRAAGERGLQVVASAGGVGQTTHPDLRPRAHPCGLLAFVGRRGARMSAMPASRTSLRPLGTLDPWSLSHHGWRKQLLIRFGAGRLLAGAAAIHYTTARGEAARRATDALAAAGNGDPARRRRRHCSRVRRTPTRRRTSSRSAASIPRRASTC